MPWRLHLQKTRSPQHATSQTTNNNSLPPVEVKDLQFNSGQGDYALSP